MNPSHALLITGARTWDTTSVETVSSATAETTMRMAFRDAWRQWGPQSVTEPLLVSGGCPSGADAMAERLWQAEGFQLLRMPADWQTHPGRAGFIRNQAMVDRAVALRSSGAEILVMAFVDLCRRLGCSKASEAQLLPRLGGHYSHGSMHCRSRARAAGLEVIDVLHPSLPPF